MVYSKERIGCIIYSCFFQFYSLISECQPLNAKSHADVFLICGHLFQIGAIPFWGCSHVAPFSCVNKTIWNDTVSQIGKLFCRDSDPPTPFPYFLWVICRSILQKKSKLLVILNNVLPLYRCRDISSRSLQISHFSLKCE